MRPIDGDKLKEEVLKWLPSDPCGIEEKEIPFETDICVSMLMEIEEAPTIEPKQGEWIPCSEGLPDLEEYVLVTLRYGETMIMALDWDDGKIEWKTQEESLIYDDEEVIAWQPLPNPWKGADDE